MTTMTARAGEYLLVQDLLGIKIDRCVECDLDTGRCVVETPIDPISNSKYRHYAIHEAMPPLSEIPTHTLAKKAQ